MLRRASAGLASFGGAGLLEAQAARTRQAIDRRMVRHLTTNPRSSFARPTAISLYFSSGFNALRHPIIDGYTGGGRIGHFARPEGAPPNADPRQNRHASHASGRLVPPRQGARPGRRSRRADDARIRP